MRLSVNTRVLSTLLSIAIVSVGTYFAIRYAQGQFRMTDSGFTPQTGLLNATSFPNGAEVYINGRLTTATDDTTYLEPGKYEVAIVKEGYTSWKKSLNIEAELVTQTNAHLFRFTPSLLPLTFSGVSNVVPAPDGQKLVYYTASASSQVKNGLYILELGSNSLLPMQRSPRQIAEDASQLDLANARFIWSPDSAELMIITTAKELVIPIDRKSNLLTISDSSFRRKQILREWEHEMYLRERQFLAEFPPEIIEIATTAAKNVYISPDKKRMLYTATAGAVLADTIVPPLPASSSQPEERQLVVGGMYVYDREEDRNFRIGLETETSPTTKQLLANDLNHAEMTLLDASASAFMTLQASQAAETANRFAAYHTSLYINTLQWFPTSRHLLFAHESNLQIMEYDGTNQATVYSGPFTDNFLYPWPDGSRIIILTSFSPGAPANLYAVELR